MNDKIKELLHTIEYYKNTQQEPTYCEELITTGELQKLLDYITNLQEEKDDIVQYACDLEDKICYKNEEINRLNKLIERIDNFVDRTIIVINQQPSGNDEWILERLNGIKYLTELRGDKNE